MLQDGLYLIKGGRIVEVKHVPDEPAEKPATKVTPQLIPVPKWSEYHPWPTQSALRHLIFERETNGFEVCMVRRGRRILIDAEKFFEWARAQGKAG